jgi:hypothetical protein
MAVHPGPFVGWRPVLGLVPTSVATGLWFVGLRPAGPGQTDNRLLDRELCRVGAVFPDEADNRGL